MAEIGVIIVAGGAGRRMGGALPKQFMMLEQQPILARSINRIHEALPKAEIVVVRNLTRDFLEQSAFELEQAIQGCAEVVQMIAPRPV